ASFGRAQDSPYPGAPTGVTAVRGTAPHTATVSWRAPSSNGGHAITNYALVPYARGTGLDPIPLGNVTSLMLTGLSDGLPYTLRVKARNDFGIGPLSAPSGSLTTATCFGKAANIVGTEGPEIGRASWR